MSGETRKRIYDSVALIGSALVIWGVISEQDLAVIKDSLPELVAVATAILARRNIHY